MVRRRCAERIPGTEDTYDVECDAVTCSVPFHVSSCQPVSTRVNSCQLVSASANGSTSEGYVCTQVGYAADNPGYDVNAASAAPLKNVVGQTGPAC